MYGTRSLGDWAATGRYLQGVKAMIAESFECVHRTNLVGMGVEPLQSQRDENHQRLGLSEDQRITIRGLADMEKPKKIVTATIAYADGSTKEVDLLCMVDTDTKFDYMCNSGVLRYVLCELAIYSAMRSLMKSHSIIVSTAIILSTPVLPMSNRVYWKGFANHE